MNQTFLHSFICMCLFPFRHTLPHRGWSGSRSTKTGQRFEKLPLVFLSLFYIFPNFDILSTVYGALGALGQGRVGPGTYGTGPGGYGTGPGGYVVGPGGLGTGPGGSGPGLGGYGGRGVGPGGALGIGGVGPGGVGGGLGGLGRGPGGYGGGVGPGGTCCVKQNQMHQFKYLISHVIMLIVYFECSVN